jgi:ribosomal protein S18 acetylase RimI-like enzyme
MTIRFCKVQKAQLAELHELSISTFKKSFGAQNTVADMEMYLSEKLNAEQLSIELENPESVFYFVKKEDTTIGYLKVNTGKAQNEQRPLPSLEIERVYVIEAWQGKGIGKKLLDKGIAIAKEQKLQKVWLGVWEKNYKALKFYTNYGFTQFGSHPFMLGNDLQTDLLMKIDI